MEAGQKDSEEVVLWGNFILGRYPKVSLGPEDGSYPVLLWTVFSFE